jgi:RNA polymerase sigma factor (sigma-70 family)
MWGMAFVFMHQNELIPHLFRTESGKITTVLCRLFGVEHLEAAQDITSDTFLAALETWTFEGIPVNPTAWLYTVAKNKAKNYFTRNQLFTGKVAKQLKLSSRDTVEMEIDLSEKNITDSQLQMLFAICHPSLPTEAQIGLALRILCGFSIDEIANAFLTNKETINKRLFRAREKWRLQPIKIEFPGTAEINTRLDAVLTTLYLLFNEGYYSESSDTLLREDLCLEAMRLTHLLLEEKQTAQPAVYALLSLMCFHASRFAARKGADGAIILYHDQDESLWNYDLIAKGASYLHQASQGTSFSKYHIEAGIAYWHTIKEDTKEKWENILQLYNHLLQIEYSPIAALNRTYVLSKVAGKETAIREAEKLSLTNNHYYYTLLGELYRDIDNQKAIGCFEKAMALAKTQTDKQAIQKQIAGL